MLHAISKHLAAALGLRILAVIRGLSCFAFFWLLALIHPVFAADTVFNYSSAGQIRGINLTLGIDTLLTTAPNTSSVNGLAANTDVGLIYYGSGTRIYYWNPAEGSGSASHHLLHDFSSGSPSAPIQNINSTAGSYLDGKYYLGSETASGYIEELYEVQMSVSGTQVVSVTPLDLLDACNCSGVQLGGFGDIAARFEGGNAVIYGSTADISGNNNGSSSGRWRFEPDVGSWTLLSTGTGGQMANSPSGTLYTNLNNSVRTFDPNTGQAGSTSLFTTSSAIWDFTSGYSYDFGDAPDSYGSAYHRMPATQNPSYYLGQIAPDNEPYSLNSAVGQSDGLGDDNTGSSDEDAVTSLQSISAGTIGYALPVQCSSGAYVVAWLDANLNGVFDANERNSNHPLSCNAGTSTLSWNTIDLNQAGTSMVRIRTSTNLSSISIPTGLAPDGEVEDHAVSIVQPTVGSCPAGSVSTIYSATGLPLAIGPNANQTTQSVINVPDSSVITDVNLRDVIGTHSYMNDLIFTLEFKGERQGLYGPTCNGSNDFSIGFNDQASGSPPCPPVDGESYPPSGSLAAFNNMGSQGDWTLEILDRYNQDGGQLQSWQLEICSLAPVANPDIRMAKDAVVNGSQLEFTLRVVNTGDVSLNNVVVEDDLDATFGAGNYSMAQAPQLLTAPSGFVINNAYDGSSNVDLLSTSSVLAIQEELLIKLLVDVQNVQAADGQYQNQASVFARDNAGTNIVDLSGEGSDVSVDTDTPTEFQLATDISLSGFVFIDSSASSSTSHDGVFQTTEIPLSNRVVTITDAVGNVVGTALSDGSGAWSLPVASSVAGSALTVSVSPQSGFISISESPSHASGLLTDAQFTITSMASTGYSDLDFGFVSMPTLTSDQSVSANAGTATKLSHRYTASTSGVVSFTLTQPSGWNTALYDDANCDGLIGPTEVLVLSDFSVNTGQQLCLIIDTFIPANAPAGMRQQIDLQAELSASDDASTGHAVVISLINNDSVTVAAASSGRLVLDKSVINITKNGPLSVGNSAAPGDILEYAISYSNQGSGSISELEINDETPSFTSLQPGSLSCGASIPGLQCAASANGSSLSWAFTGSLSAGTNGQVSYRVLVD